VEGEVEVVSRSGYTLRTDRLAYHQADRTIRTEAPVRLTSARLELDGVGLNLDLGSRRLRVLSRVHAHCSRTARAGELMSRCWMLMAVITLLAGWRRPRRLAPAAAGRSRFRPTAWTPTRSPRP